MQDAVHPDGVPCQASIDQQNRLELKALKAQRDTAVAKAAVLVEAVAAEDAAAEAACVAADAEVAALEEQ